jgi:hypothetical protein
MHGWSHAMFCLIGRPFGRVGRRSEVMAKVPQEGSALAAASGAR